MMSMINIKNLAMVFLFLVLICALFVAVLDMVTNTTIPSVVATVLGAGVGYSITILGINHSIDTLNGSIRDTVTGALNANTKQPDKIVSEKL